MRKIERIALACLTASLMLAGCLRASDTLDTAAALPSSTADFRTVHDPSLGWTAPIPAGWVSCFVPGGQYSRGLPTADPTRLMLWTYPNRSPAEVLSELEESGGIIDTIETGARDSAGLHWVRYQGGARSDAELAVAWALAGEGIRSHLVLVVANKAEIDALVETILLPVVDGFLPGPPDTPSSLLASAPPPPDYWPTRGWRTASPDSQQLDAAQLDAAQLAAMVTLIRQEALQIDSVFVVRHGYVVLDVDFQSYRSTDLHDLHSATKSITSALVGMALDDRDMPVNTRALKILSPWRPAHNDERKQSMTVEHLLTMTAGLEWQEWGADYAPGTGNDLVNMVETAPDWTQYVLDRPMSAEPGDEFLYNSGASYLLSAVVSRLTGKTAADYARDRLFTPLGIRDYTWPSGPEGVTQGWGNLRMRPEDLARIGLLYLQRGMWDGRQIVPREWVEASTTDQVADPVYEYGYQWWLDSADEYAYMSGRFGQTVIVAPRQDMVIVIMSSLPETLDSAIGIPRWLAEKYLLPAPLPVGEE